MTSEELEYMGDVEIMNRKKLDYLNNLSKQIEYLQKPLNDGKNPSNLDCICLNFDEDWFCIAPDTISNFDNLVRVIFHFLECELQKLKKEFEEA